MRLTTIAALAAGINLAAIGSAFAADSSTGTMNGVNHGAGGAKARCTPGDPNVLVDQKAKTFTLDTKMKSAGTKTGMVSMCKSEALSMGAKMSGKGSMMKKSSM